MSVKPLTKDRIRAILNLLPVLLNTVCKSATRLDAPCQLPVQEQAQRAIDEDGEDEDDAGSQDDMSEALRQHLRCLIGAVGENVKQFVLDYNRLIEIAGYVRGGGVKSMIYRLETGRAQVAATDYFEEAVEKLSVIVRPGELPGACDGSKLSLMESLKSVSEEEEEAVKSCLGDLDDILLSASRQQAIS